MLFMRGWETALSIIIQKAGGNMNIQEIIDKKISKLSDEITMASDNIASNKINKADYDKTLIGFVSEKIVPENPKDDNDYKWRIQTNGVAYDIKPSACNITSVGQRVRLYVPNHSFKDKYAEVIDDGGYNHPTKVVFNDNDNTITETYNLIDNTVETKKYTLTIINEGQSGEEVTAITFPDGSIMTLEGFVIG